MTDREKAVKATEAMMTELEKLTLPDKAWESVLECLRSLSVFLPDATEE